MQMNRPTDPAKIEPRDARAKRSFDPLSYSNKRRLLIPIEDAKSAETRERRVAKTVAMLSEGLA